MAKTSIRKFSYLGHEIEIIRERSNLPPISTLEPRVGVQVRYGLKFDSHVIEWSEFVAATENEAAANHMAQRGLQRARVLRKREVQTPVLPAA